MKMRKKTKVLFTAGVFLLMMTGNALAHFGMLVPSDSMVMQGDKQKVSLNISFNFSKFNLINVS